MATQSTQSRWQRVVRRQVPQKDSFVYAVITTGIYCVPGCPSRRPRRENVAFFDTPTEAEAQGYRPCKRCRPGAGIGSSEELKVVIQICQRLKEEDSSWKPSLRELSEPFGWSESRLKRAFQTQLGISPRKFAEEQRLGRFRKEIIQGRSVTDALHQAGFGSSSGLYETAGETLGMTPGQYAQKGQGITLHWVTVPSPLGLLLVARTEKGICSVQMGDSRKALLDGLKQEFSQAQILPGTRELEDQAQAVVASLDGMHSLPELPLDLRATAFQRQVWQLLKEIPRGETRSYGELASLCNPPSGPRAVARACATNPVALLIPCHRVIPKNQPVGQYRWGRDRKQQLLEQESQKTDDPESP